MQRMKWGIKDTISQSHRISNHDQQTSKNTDFVKLLQPKNVETTLSNAILNSNSNNINDINNNNSNNDSNNNNKKTPIIMIKPRSTKPKDKNNKC